MKSDLTPDEAVDRLIEGEPAHQVFQGEQQGGWRQNFPDAHVPPEIDKLVSEGKLSDVSWSSENSPTFVAAGANVEEDTVPQLVVQSVHPQDRHFGEMGRFLVVRNSLIEYDSDDMSSALSRIQPTAPAATAPQAPVARPPAQAPA